MSVQAKCAHCGEFAMLHGSSSTGALPDSVRWFCSAVCARRWAMRPENAESADAVQRLAQSGPEAAA